MGRLIELDSEPAEGLNAEKKGVEGLALSQLNITL